MMKPNQKEGSRSPCGIGHIHQRTEDIQVCVYYIHIEICISLNVLNVYTCSCSLASVLILFAVSFVFDVISGSPLFYTTAAASAYCMQPHHSHMLP